MQKALFQQSIIQRKLFSENFVIALIEELSCIGAGFIDGLIISIFLGSTAIAAEGLIHPFFSLVGIISGATLLGTKKICVNLICKNEQSKAQGVYSSSVYFALACSLLITAACIFFSGPIVRMLGATDAELFDDARMYLLGLSIGAPTLVLVPVMTPIMQLSGRKLPIKLSLITIAVIDVVLDTLSALLGFGMLGMGLSTSIAQIIGFIILVFPTKQPSVLKLNIRTVQFRHIISVIREGMPKIIRRACNFIKPVTVNILIISFAGSFGMSAMSVRNNLSNFTECVGAALGATVLLLSVMYAAEQNETSLINLKKRVFIYIAAVIMPLSALLIIFSPQIAAIYIHDSELALDYAAQAIRFMAIDLIFIAVMEILTGYWQGIGRTREINGIVFFQKLVYPIICLVLCHVLFGTRGVWISFPLATLLTILTFGAISLFRNRKLKFFPLPEDCIIPDTKKIEYVVRSLDEISAKAEEIQKTCIDSGINSRDAMFISLSFEESARIILERGVAKKEDETSFDFFAAITNGKVTLRFRDNCIKYREISYFDMFTYDPEHPESHIGTRIVMKKAKNVEHVSMFGTNNMIIEF